MRATAFWTCFPCGQMRSVSSSSNAACPADEFGGDGLHLLRLGRALLVELDEKIERQTR
jgi:hypothetical protein